MGSHTTLTLYVCFAFTISYSVKQLRLSQPKFKAYSTQTAAVRSQVVHTHIHFSDSQSEFILWITLYGCSSVFFCSNNTNFVSDGSQQSHWSQAIGCLLPSPPQFSLCVWKGLAIIELANCAFQVNGIHSHGSVCPCVCFTNWYFMNKMDQTRSRWQQCWCLTNI